MHDSAPIPPDPESERRGHEMRDVAIRPILYFLIGLFVFGGVLELVMSTIMRGIVAEDTKVGVPSPSIVDARTIQERSSTRRSATTARSATTSGQPRRSPSSATPRPTCSGCTRTRTRS